MPKERFQNLAKEIQPNLHIIKEPIAHLILIQSGKGKWDKIIEVDGFNG